MIVSNRNTTNHPTLFFNDVQIDEVHDHKHLGIIINKKLTWQNHIDSIVLKAQKRLDILHRWRYKLDRRSLEILYFTHIRPVLEYGDVLLSNCDQNSMDKIENVEICAAKIVSGAIKKTPKEKLYNE